MAVSSLEEIIEQRRRQKETAERNAQRAATTNRTYGPQTQAQAAATKKEEEKKPFFAGYTAPPKQPAKATQPTVAPDKAKPKYEPVRFVPASDRTKDDDAVKKYTPVPYLPPGKEKDDKDKPTRPAYKPIEYKLIPSGQPMSIGVDNADRPDTGVSGLQMPVAPALGQTVPPSESKVKPYGGRQKDDEAFPDGKPFFSGYSPAGSNNTGVMGGVSPAIPALNNAIGGGDWGKTVSKLAGVGADAVTDKLNQFGRWGADMTGDGDPFSGYQNTPGADYANQADRNRRADDKTYMDKLWSDVAGGFYQVFYVPGKAIETTPVPGLGVSAGQVGSAVGEAVNRWANPFNPNQINKDGKGVDTPTTNAAFDWMKQNLPVELASGLVPFVQPWTTMWDIGAPQLQQSIQVRENYNALSRADQEKANIAGINIISGPDRWQKSIDALLNQEATVQDLEAKAREAYITGDAELAASYGAQAYKLQNTSATELVDEQSNVWAEIIGGIVFDPTNLIPGGVIGDAWKAYRTKKVFDVAADVGVSRLDDAMRTAEKILSGGAPGQAIDMRKWWQKVNPLSRTADTQANMAADQLFSTTAQVFGQVTDKADAATIMRTWLSAPGRLIEGVTGLVSPGITEASADGAYRIGAGVIANNPVVEKFPILQRAADDLLNMRSLSGEGVFNPVEFLAEADTIIYKNARKMFGLDVLDDLPVGAVSTRLRRLADGTGVIEYLDKAKKVIQTSTPEVFANAQDTYKTLQKAFGAQGTNLYEALRTPDRLQRAIMSDMYLALRPAHWIRNAASATATLMSDGIYSVKALDERIAWWAAKHGGAMPEAGLFGSLEGAERGITTQLGEAAGDQNWTRKFWPENNPYAALVEAGNKFWGGFTNAAGIPFGENAFRLTAFDTAGQRVFLRGWTNAVESTYGPVLKAAGLDDGVAKRVMNTIIDAGVSGDKAGVVQTVRNVLSGNTMPTNLRDLGIPDELVSMETWKKLNSYLSEATPDRIDEVVDAIRMTFKDEAQRFGRILNEAPPQPGVYAWTNVEAAQDGADIIDTLTDAAKRAGIDPSEAQKTAQTLVTRLNESVTKSWDAFRNDLAQNNNPGALNFAMDTWAQYYDLKRAARAQVDAASKQAIATGGGQAWAQKWQETQRVWTEFGQKSSELFQTARGNLMDVGNGVQVPQQYDWWNVISRYISYDEQAVSGARTAGKAVGGVADDGFTAAIEANRVYLDASVAEVFDAFRRTPTMDSFDLLVNTQRRIDQLGAQAATFLADKRAEMLPKRAKEFYRLRNEVWAQFFDNAVIHNNATQRLIISDGVAQQAASKLRWTDEFAGGEFRLVGKNADGTWQAVRTSDGTMHSFAGPGSGSSALPTVPKEILADYNTVTNQSGKIVDSLVADIKMSRPGAPTAASGQTVVNMDWSKKTGWNPFGLVKGESDLHKMIGETVNRKIGTKTPEMGDVAVHMIDQLQSAERKIIDALPGILQGSPNTLTSGQRLQAIDTLNDLMPAFDNVLAQSTKAGTDAMNFAMLNFRSRRNIDTALAMVVPFHYFWSRSAFNWGKRVLQKPALLNLWYESQRGIAIENQQADLPNRLQGTLPNPLNQYGIGNERMGNPVNWILPFASYMGSEFENPEEAQGEAERLYLMWKKWTPGLLPALQYAADTALDQTSPNKDGTTRAGSYQVGDFVPFYRMAGYIKQTLTGNNLPSAGDEWDQDRIKRAVAEGATNGADVATSQYAQQIAKNRELGRPDAEGIPPESFEAANEIYMNASKAAGGDRLETLATGYMTGNPTYNYNPAEAEQRAAQSEYTAVGYDAWKNPFGSKQAKSAVTDENPGMPVWFSRNDDKPGEAGRRTSYWNEIIPLYESQTKSVAEFLTQNPDATRDELKEFKAESQAAIDAVKAKYPGLELSGGSGGSGGMNPREQAQEILEDILTYEVSGKPEKLAAGATPEQERAYYAAYEKWNNARLDRLDSVLNQKIGEEPSFPDPAQEELRKLIEGEYVSELLRKNYLTNASDVEKEWNARISLNEEISAAEWDKNEASARERVGDEGVALLREYYALPKDSEERKAFKAANPAVNTAQVAMYSPDKYDEVVEKFGDDAWDVFEGQPRHPGDGATEDQLNAYHAQMDKYNAAHPYSSSIDMYVTGRRRQYNPEAGVKYYDWGKDYNEAIAIFGPNIFQIVDNFPEGKDAQHAYYNAHPEIAGFWEWNKALKDTVAPVVPEPEPAVIDPTTYTGERPVGSGRIAVDGNPNPVGGGAGETSFFPGFGTPPASKASGGTSGVASVVAGDDTAGMTWQDWAARNPKYGKGGNAEFAAATASVTSEFDAESVAIWNAYYALPKDSKAREDYKAAHPELRAMTMAGYNPEEYKQAKELFGEDAWMEWSNIPAYADTDEARAARAAYLEDHPQAKLLQAWVNGRPSNFDESAAGDDFAYNFGADFAEAERMFGEDIWSIWAGYSSGWDKATKRAYHNQYPKLGEMMDWWYGNSEGGQGRSMGAAGGTGRPYGGRSYGGGGGGGGYSGWGGGDSGNSGFPVDLNMPYIQAEEMSRELQTQAPRPAQRRNFNPNWWLSAGDRVGPDKVKEWRPPSKRTYK